MEQYFINEQCKMNTKSLMTNFVIWFIMPINVFILLFSSKCHSLKPALGTKTLSGVNNELSKTIKRNGTARYINLYENVEG